jgi:hypothetical protein
MRRGEAGHPVSYYSGRHLVVSPRCPTDHLLRWEAGQNYISTDGGASSRAVGLYPQTAGTVCQPGGYCRSQLIGVLDDADSNQYAYKSFDAGET